MFVDRRRLVAKKRRPNAQRSQDKKSGTAQKRPDIETQFELSESFNQSSFVDMEDKESGTTVTKQTVKFFDFDTTSVMLVKQAASSENLNRNK